MGGGDDDEGGESVTPETTYTFGQDLCLFTEGFADGACGKFMPERVGCLPYCTGHERGLVAAHEATRAYVEGLRAAAREAKAPRP